MPVVSRLILCGCLSLVWQSHCRAAESAPLSDSDKLTQLGKDYWEYRLHESPLLATSVGDRHNNASLDQVSIADWQRRNKQEQEFLADLERLSETALSPEEQTNRQILIRLLGDSMAEYKFGAYLMPVTQRTGFYLDFPQIPQDTPFVSTEDYDNYLHRLAAFAEYADQNLALMREGIRRRLVVPAVVMEGWEEAIDSQIVSDPTKSALYDPLQRLPTTVPTTEHERLQYEAQTAISESVVPAYRRIKQFLAIEYVPHLRDTIAAAALPDGQEFYRHRVRNFTTTDMTPGEVHQLGLREVMRIRQEMQQVIDQVGFEGDFAAFLKFLREDPQFYANTTDELMKEVAYILKRMDGRLPSLFGTLPRIPYGIKPVPDFIAPRTTSAYYWRAADRTKAGFFFVNTYNLKSRPFYNLESLSLHEAVPGHHLQLALQQEMKSLPEFRKYTDFTAFVEGWALYAEHLGLEAGFYQDPYSNFGRLTMEIWRACRLVVDTGMHYFGWSREQAINYLAENTALAMHDIEAEVDRYISWPGQALAYKIGELKIRELRALAEEQLGSKFDIREFHDQVLAAGAVPLDVLETNIKTWLATKEQ